MSEQGLSDYLSHNLRVIIVGDNPGITSHSQKHWYAHKSNQFWRLMYESGLIPTPLGPEDDSRLVEYGIGLTCLVPRASTSTSEISKAEWRSGYAELLKKIAQYRPFCVAFNGKSVFEVATGRKCTKFGLQEPIQLTLSTENDSQLSRNGLGKMLTIHCFVLPSTSSRARSYSFEEKLTYFKELKDFIFTCST